jgi:hypothetical protein
VDEGSIERLFKSVLDDPDKDTEEVREVFSILVRATLRYRDHVLSSEGVVVTVGDVRAALRWLTPALATGNLPMNCSGRSLGLLKEWLAEMQKVSLSAVQ